MGTGWQSEMTEDEFQSAMQQLEFYPARVVKHDIEADNSVAFFCDFNHMRLTKQAMMRLNKLKRRWRIKRETPFFAYPRMLDVHWKDETKYDDEDSAADSDIDEP